MLDIWTELGAEEIFRAAKDSEQFNQIVMEPTHEDRHGTERKRRYLGVFCLKTMAKNSMPTGKTMLNH